MAIILAVNAVSLRAYHRMNVNSEGNKLVEQKRLTLSDCINQKRPFALSVVSFSTPASASYSIYVKPGEPLQITTKACFATDCLVPIQRTDHTYISHVVIRSSMNSRTWSTLPFTETVNITCILCWFCNWPLSYYATSVINEKKIAGNCILRRIKKCSTAG